MNEEQRNILLRAGWQPELLDKLALSDVHPTSSGFGERAHAALRAINVGAIDHCLMHPGIPTAQLAEILSQMSGQRVTGFGFAIAAYTEARRQGVVRQVAKDFLTRAILEEFPKGWDFDESVAADIRLTHWESELLSSCPKMGLETKTNCILDSLVRSHPPSAGWIPLPSEDPHISKIFDACWPIL